MFHFLSRVSSISLTGEKDEASVWSRFFLPEWDPGRPRVTRLLPWIQPQKCAPVLQKRSLRRWSRNLWSSWSLGCLKLPQRSCLVLVPVGKQGFESQVCYHWLLWLICIVTIKFHKMSINIIIFINSIKFITFIIVIIFIILFIFVILIISIIFTIFLLFIFWYHHSSYNIMQNNCFFNVLSAWNYLIWKCNVSCVKSIFEIVLLSESIQCLTCHLHMDDCKSCVGSVIPSPPWHNCNWNCTVISVESTFWIVLLLEKHMDSHIDSVGSVTFLEIFSKIKNHLY